MKLIDSETEKEYRLQLIKSNHSLFNSESKLLSELRRAYPQLITAYILDWLPEQGEDIYTILINDNIVATIEVEKDGSKESVVELSTVLQYVGRISKQNQIKLAVALDLARKEMEIKQSN
jgi:hypothetical protein